MNSPEDKIIRLLAQGDAQAMAMIYDHYANTLYGVVRRMVGNDEWARDVLQEGFVKIWSNAAHYDSSKAKLFTWMVRIMRNSAIDKMRSEQTRGNHAIQMAAAAVSQENTQDFKPELLDVPEKVDALEPKYREVVEALFFSGMTQQEASEALEVPLGTVKTRLKIALRELRKVFSEQHLGLLLVVSLIP